MRFITSMAASPKVIEASSRFDLEMEVASVRLRLSLRADNDVDRSAGGRGVWMYAMRVLTNADTRRLPLSDDVFRSLVVSETHEPRVPQMVLSGPFNEFELPHEHWFQPAAIHHFLRG